MPRIILGIAVWSLAGAVGCAESPEAAAQHTSADTRAPGDSVETADSGADDDLPWRVYDAMHDRPSSQGSLGRHGVVPAHVFYKGWVSAGDDTGVPPTEQRVKEFAQKIPRGVLTCMDLEGEDWTLVVRRKPPGDFHLDKDNYAAFLRMARWINQANPELRWGFFAHPPSSHPARIAWVEKRKGNEEKSQRYLGQWHDLQEEMSELYREVDAIFVASYYTDRYESFAEFQDWLEFYLGHYEPLYDKPVYIFMCPLDPYSNSPSGAKFLTAEQWRWCLDFAYANTDGLLLWSDIPFDWNTHAQGKLWWRETVRFLREINRAEHIPDDGDVIR